MTEREIIILKRMYEEGRAYESIAKKLDYPTELVKNTARLLISTGDLQKRERRKMSVEIEERQNKVAELSRMGFNAEQIAVKMQVSSAVIRGDKCALRKRGINVEPLTAMIPKQATGTVKCTAAISRTCIYGVQKDKGNGRCRFSECTGKCRSVTTEFFQGCKASECIYYTKITRENKRRESITDGGVAYRRYDNVQ